MVINSLEIANFRSHARSAIALRSRTFLFGRNNSGKSTALDAIRFALTGKLEGIDGANRNIVELINERSLERLTAAQSVEERGSFSLGVRLRLNDPTLAPRRQSDGREVFLDVNENGKDWRGSKTDKQTELYKRIGATEAEVLACLDSSAFLRLHHADAKALTMRLMDAKIPATPLEPLGIGGPLTVEQLGQEYKRAFDKRTVAKRDLDRHSVYPAPTLLDGEEPPSVAAITEQLDDLRNDEAVIVRDSSELLGRKREILRQIEELTTDKLEIEKRIASYGDPDRDCDTIESRLEAWPGLVLEAEPEMPAPPTFARLNLEGDERERDAKQEALVDARGRLKVIEEQVGYLAKHNPSAGCVLDPSVPCKTPAKSFAARLEALRALLEQTENEIGAGAEQLEAVRALITRRRDEAAATEAKASAEYRAAAAARDKVRKSNKAAEERHRSERAAVERSLAEARARAGYLQQDQATLAQVLERIERLGRDLIGLGDVQEPEGLDQVRARIKAGEQILEEATRWHEANRLHRESRDAHADLEREVAWLEHLVEQLGPKGLVVDALETARAAFEARVNRALAKWGYSIGFVLDPWLVRVNGRPSSQLSISERLRVGIALQLAVAELCGLMFVTIDQVDLLDAENRAILLEVLDGWSGQAVIASMRDERDGLPTGADVPPDTAMYWIDRDQAGDTTIAPL